MTLAALLALAAVGFVVGFVAGLVGIGGGVLIVPFLYFFYEHAQWSGISLDAALHGVVASATSLFIIIPTAIAGMLTYHRAGLLAWRPVLPIGIAAALSATFSAIIAARVPAPLLKIFFGCFLVFTAWQMVRRRGAVAAGPERHSLLLSALTGLAVGAFSALLGVGGGLVAIPLLMYVIRLDVTRLAATSLAIVFFAATAGTFTYMLTGWNVGQLPAGHVGFVHVAAALPMIPGAMLAARWGAQVNQKMDAQKLRWLFATLFVVIGLRIIITNVTALLAP